MTGINDLIQLAQALFGALGTAMTTLTAYWWVFLPLGMMVFKFLIGSSKGLLGYRRGRRGRR